MRVSRVQAEENRQKVIDVASRFFGSTASTALASKT